MKKIFKLISVLVIVLFVGLGVFTAIPVNAAYSSEEDYLNGNQHASLLDYGDANADWNGLQTKYLGSAVGGAKYIRLNSWSEDGVQAYNGTYSIGDERWNNNWNYQISYLKSGEFRYEYIDSNVYNDGVNRGGMILNEPSRIIFNTKFRVAAGTVLSVVGAGNDSRTSGGNNLTDGNSVYWNVIEFDSEGYPLYDGDWRDATQTWKVGEEENKVDGVDASYGPSIRTKDTKVELRKSEVAYVMILIRVASGDKTQGAGGNLNISRRYLHDNFPNMYIVADPFTYTFSANYGSIDGKTYKNIQRIGISPYEYNTTTLMSFPTAVRNGYTLNGWKLTSGTQSSSNKQYGNIYFNNGTFTSDGVTYPAEVSGKSVLSNNKYYTSLFKNASFEAQWVPTVYNIAYDLQGGSVSGNPSTYTIETSTFTLNNPTRAGYEFTGWTGSNGATPQITVTINKGSTGDKHYVANWKVADYDITYDLQGGSVSGNPSKYNIDTPTFTLNNPTKTGYKFTGWTGTDLSGNTMTVTVNKGSIGDRSYTAHWETTEVDVTVQHFVMDINGKFPLSPTKTAKKQLTVEKSFKNDYGDNYFVDASLLQEGVITLGSVSYPSEKVSADSGKNVVKVYYARKAYTITFNVSKNLGYWDEDREDMSDTIGYFYYGSTIDLSKYKAYAALSHNGWSTDYNAKSGLSGYTVKGNATLYALFKGEIKVGFTDAAGRVEEKVTIYNRERSVTITSPALRAYTWDDVSNASGLGWTTEPDVTGSGGATVQLKANTSYTTSESIEFYGVYSADANVEFDVNGGTPNDNTKPQSIKVYKNAGDLGKTKGGEVTLPSCDRPGKNNGDGTLTIYTLRGWNKDDAFVGIPGGKVTIDSNTTFVAQWDSKVKAIEYDIVFDINGGKPDTTPAPIKNIKYDQKVVVPDKGSRIGFDLIGWGTKPSGGTVYDINTEVSKLTTEDGATVTLYAQWRQKKFFLTKIGSSRYGATFTRCLPGQESWLNGEYGSKLTIDVWGQLTEQEKLDKSQHVFKVDKNGNITQVK